MMDESQDDSYTMLDESLDESDTMQDESDTMQDESVLLHISEELFSNVILQIEGLLPVDVMAKIIVAHDAEKGLVTLSICRFDKLESVTQEKNMYLRRKYLKAFSAVNVSDSLKAVISKFVYKLRNDDTKKRQPRTIQVLIISFVRKLFMSISTLIEGMFVTFR